MGLGGGDMQSLAHHVTCNVFENIYIWKDRNKLSHATIAAFSIAQSTWYMHKIHISSPTFTWLFNDGVSGGNVEALILQPIHA